MRKNILLLCNGLSGSGKTYFIQNILPDVFYNLKSFTTRPMRAGEQNGDKYYFVSERAFDSQPMATRLFVNQALWRPGKPKWLYGVPEFEVYDNIGRDMVYDVIQPCYSRQLIDWFNQRGLDKYYDYRIAWFQPQENRAATIRGRANMPDDEQVRRQNTCNADDFARANLSVDYMVESSAARQFIPPQMIDMMNMVRNIRAGFVPKIRAD